MIASLLERRALAHPHCVQIENGAAVDVRRESSTLPGLTTFGEDACGELYAAAQGRVYKLTR